MKIGLILKRIRLEKEYTLQEVAGRIKMTASHLSQIENDKISPSLHFLEELLRLYAVNMSDFFRQVEQVKYVVVRGAGEEVFRDEERGLRLKLLASKLQNNALESYRVEMDPGSSIDVNTIPREQNGERMMLVLAGRLMVLLDEETQDMGEGDSVNFKAWVRCRISNDSGERAELLLTGLPPVFR